MDELWNFGWESVVMIPSASAIPESVVSPATALSTPLRSCVIGRRIPIMPVEATTTSDEEMPKTSAVCSAVL